MRLAIYALVAVAVLLGGICAKLYLDYSSLSSNYATLTDLYRLLQTEHNSLKSSHQALQQQYSSLVEKHTDLENIYRDLHLEYSSLLLRYNNLLANFTSLENMYNQLRYEHNSLQLRYSDLLANYTMLEDIHKQLKYEYSSLQAKFADLEDKYKQLQIEYSKLQLTYLGLLANYTSLENRYNQLKLDYETLSSKYQQLQEQYRDLLDKYTALDKEYNLMLSKYNTLLGLYTSLENDYKSLQADYNTLLSKYNTLLMQYTVLQLQYNSLLEISTKVNSSLAELVSTLFKYCCIPYAFERVLNIGEVLAIGQYVVNAKVYANDLWTSIQNIYKWIRSNVRYVYDVSLPIPKWVVCDPKTKLCYYYEFTDFENQVQTPRFTAYYGQGDCDDQAVLAYAMMKYYFLYVHGKDYRLWIAHIRMGDGGGHLAVFLPVQGGMLTIIDPAGAYLTSTTLGVITARPAYDELTRYSSYWGIYGGVKHISLYRVDVASGGYTLEASGDITTIASYINSTT